MSENQEETRSEASEPLSGQSDSETQTKDKASEDPLKGTDRNDENSQTSTLDEEYDGDLTEQELSEELYWQDLLAAALVIFLAFLLSFYKISANNVELWQHLKTGEFIVSNGAIPDTDIFSYTAAGRPWINTSWLYDIGTHLIQNLAGFKALVAIKALAVVGLTLLLLSLRHLGRTMWWTVCTTTFCLVIMAHSSRNFAVSPKLATYLALTLQLAIIHQVSSRNRQWMLWLFIPLQILWVNLDSNYYMGLLLLVMYLAGEFVIFLFRSVRHSLPSPEPDTGLKFYRPKIVTLALVVLLSTIGCLLNPYDLKNPAGLVVAQQAVSQYTVAIPGLREFNYPLRELTGIWNDDFFNDPFTGMFDPGVISLEEYLTGFLAIMTLFSFFMNRPNFQFSRFLIFISFLFVGVSLLENMYLLVLVSTMALTLNGQEWYLNSFGTRPRLDTAWLIWSRGGRILTVLSFFVLFLWGGAGRFRNSLGDDLGLGLSSSALDTVQTVTEQMSSLPPSTNIFNFEVLPDNANLLIQAGFPERKIFLDDRLSLYKQKPDGQPLPENGLTSVKLAAVPDSVIFPRSGQSPSEISLTQPLERMPRRVVIPEKFQKQLTYNLTDRQLQLEGPLEKEQFLELGALAYETSAPPGMAQAGPSLNTISLQLSRTRYVRALQALYTKSRTLFDSEKGELQFRGTMSPDDYAALMSFSEETDYRVAVDQLFDQSQDLLETYLRLRYALRDGEVDVWKPVFDKYNIGILTLNMRESQPYYNTFVALTQNEFWIPVQPLSGSLAVFIRSDVDTPELAQYRNEKALDVQSLAYQPSDETPAETAIAIPVQEHSWWYDWLWRDRLVGDERLQIARHYHTVANNYLTPQGLMSVADAAAWQMLAIRKIREMLPEHPGNPNAYVLLGLCYNTLLELDLSVYLIAKPEPGTPRNIRVRRFLREHRIRYLQVIAALNQALLANPNEEVAHFHLYRWYRSRGNWDLTLRHLRKLDELLEGDEDGSLQRQQEIVQLEQRVENMKDELNRLRMNPLPAAPSERAGLALDAGFPALAMEELGEFSLAALESGPLYVMLCLETGQHEKAVDPLENLRDAEVFEQGQWEEIMGTVRLLQGNYDLAAESWKTALQSKQYSSAAEFLHGAGIVIPQWPQFGTPIDAGQLQGPALPLANSAAKLMEQIPFERASGNALIGLAYLETPYVDRAAAPIQKALDLYPDHPLRPIYTYYLTRLTGEELDPLPPSEYIEPEFAPEPTELSSQ